jgi:hypothetical protein
MRSVPGAGTKARSMKPLFEQRKPVVTPERLAREQKERYAEHVVRGLIPPRPED